MAETWTILRLLDWCREFFASKEIASARLDAEVLLAHVLGVNRLELYLRYDQPLSADELGAMRALVRRRGAREPVAHLVGTREFYGLSFISDARALVPRPETELLVDVTLAALPEAARRVCEVGAGSGCVVATLATQRPEWTLVATEPSETARALAAENIARHEVGARVDVVAGSFFANVDGPFDAVISNPPYIERGVLETLMPEVARHEPRLALDGGLDGLDVIRELVARAGGMLVPGGFFALECGAGQAGAVAELFAAAGFSGIEKHRDLADIERVVGGRGPV
jgi:release factor glutamine methyltransferase